MKKLRIICALLICASMILLSSCKNIGVFSGGSKELKIGVSGIEGILNPFYAEADADIEIISQMFSPIQRTNTNNSLVNHAGGISYEFVDGDKVKLTVAPKGFGSENMSKMKINHYVVGMVQTNCYVVINDETKECFVIEVTLGRVILLNS